MSTTPFIDKLILIVLVVYLNLLEIGVTSIAGGSGEISIFFFAFLNSPQNVALSHKALGDYLH